MHSPRRLAPQHARSLIEKYSKAAQLTAPKMAALTPGLAVDGYWLDDQNYFFLAERLEPSLNRIVTVPSIANAQTSTVSELLPLDALARLLSDVAKQSVDLLALSSAEFDMPNADTLVVELTNQIYRIDWRRRRVIDTRPCLDVPALYSPNGRFACFVRGFDLWVKDLESGTERPITKDGEAHNCYGQQPETASATITYRKRPSPMGIWSADSQWFLSHRIDERSVPELGLVQHSPPGGGRPVEHRYKFAMPGDPLPIATYVAIHVESGRQISFEEHPAPVLSWSPFTYRMAWFAGSSQAFFLRLDRYRRNAELVRLDLEREISQVIIGETTESGYLDLHPIIGMTPNIRTLGSDEVIWFSERDGWGHLYLYDGRSGALKNQITHGNMLVRDIVHVDETARSMLLLVNGVDPHSDPAYKSLCRVNFDGSGFHVLLSHEGDVFVPKSEPWGLDQSRPHRSSSRQAGISPSGRFATVRFASVRGGNQTKLVDLHTRQDFLISSAIPSSDEIKPRHFSAFAADGVTKLHGVMFLPSNFSEERSYPLIDFIYPGPQIAHQPQSFRSAAAAPAIALAEVGFVTVMFDTRGMPVGSKAFHQGGYPQLLEPQLSDHAAVIRQLCSQYSFIDSDRIGIFGQSGGGAATARALFDYGDLFKVGVSVCGNHNPDYYTANWSDRYRGPRDAEAWSMESNTAAAHKLRGKLLLISGDMDDNVHVSHTLGLAGALIKANRDFDLLIVPNEGHSLLMTNGYVQRRLWDYFVLHLLKETPPTDFQLQFEPYELRFLAKSFAREREQ